jgi:uncharacterized protein YjbI with pentapeptide repeats
MSSNGYAPGSLTLRGQTFRGQPLQGADFRSADLRGANFTSTNLRSANLRDARVGALPWIGGVVLPSAMCLRGRCSHRIGGGRDGERLCSDELDQAVVAGVVIVTLVVFVGVIF